MSKNFLEVKNVDFIVGGQTKVKNVSFSIQNEGDVICLLGPSGIGKTTILRTIAGFLDPILGRINIDGCDVFNSQNKSGYIPSEQRNVGMVFQDFALFRKS